jgi:tetratricopeptide (TPR) repeat protein
VEYVIDDLRRNGSFMGDRTEGIDLGDWHSPDISGAYIMKGSLVFDQGRYEEALSWYGKALEVNPSSAITILEVSECHKAMGNMAEALERAKEALGIAWELSTIAKARRTVAFCEGELGDHDACAANLVISGDYEPSIIVTNEFLWLRSQGWAGQMTLDDALRIAPEQTPGIAASNLAQEAMVVTMKLIQEARIGDISLLQEIMTNLLMSERSTRSQVTNREDVATA